MKISLQTIIRGAFSMYFKNPFLYSGVYIVVMLPAVLISTFFLEESLSLMIFAFRLGVFSQMLGTATILVVLSIVISFITGVLTLGGCIHLADNMYEGRPLRLIDALSFAFKKAVVYINLSLRIFWYVFSSVLVLVIVYMIINAVIDTLVARGYIGSIAWIQTLILWAFNIVIISIAIIRSLRSVFAFFILFDEKNITGREAFKKSLELTKSNLLRIIGYGIVITFIVSSVSLVIWHACLLVLINIPYGTAYSVLAFIFGLLQGALLFPLSVIFFFLFYRIVKNEKSASVLSRSV